MRDLSRLHEISRVFIRHGLGDLVRRVGVASLLERAGEVLLWAEVARSAQLEPEQRLRLAFEELGPTFVKLGQMLSMRRTCYHRSGPRNSRVCAATRRRCRSNKSWR